MAKLIPTTIENDPLNPIDETIPGGLPALPWRNATKNINTAFPTPNAIICPPNSNIYYEYGDVNGTVCLQQYQTPTTPPNSDPPEGPTTPPPVVLVPTITKTAIPEPSNSRRATIIEDTFETNLPSLIPQIYSIGSPNANQPVVAIIRNNCINSELELSITKSPYITLDIGSKVVIPPITTLQFEVSLNESEIKKLGKSTPRVLNGELNFSIKPLNSSSHIYVQINQEIGDVTLPPPIAVSESFAPIELNDVLLPSPIIVNTVL